MKRFVILAALAAAACQSGDLARLNPFRNAELPEVKLGSLFSGMRLPQLPTYALTDLLPEMAFLRDAPPDVAAGYGGYVGEVSPYDGALPLALRETRDRPMSVRVTGKGRDYALRGYLSTVALGGDMLWDLRVLSFEDRRGRIGSLRPPLATGRMTTAPDGRVRGVAVDFPALRERGEAAPPQGSAEYETLADAFRYLSPPLPGKPVAPGDRLGQPRPLQRLLAHTTAKPARDSQTSRVVGRTVYKGRDSLLVVHDGEVAYSAGADRVVLSVAGHSLYDLETGQLAHSVLRLTRSGSIDGRPADDLAYIETAVELR
jgi:hypothetical protein